MTGMSSADLDARDSAHAQRSRTCKHKQDATQSNQSLTQSIQQADLYDRSSVKEINSNQCRPCSTNVPSPVPFPHALTDFDGIDWVVVALGPRGWVRHVGVLPCLRQQAVVEEGHPIGVVAWLAVLGVLHDRVTGLSLHHLHVINGGGNESIDPCESFPSNGRILLCILDRISGNGLE